MSSISLNHNYKLSKPTLTSTFFPSFSPRSSIKLFSFNTKCRIPILCTSSSSKSRTCRNYNSSNSSGWNSSNFVEIWGSLGKWVFNFAAGAIAVTSICLDFDSPALAESLTVAFPVSRSVEVVLILPPFLFNYTL